MPKILVIRFSSIGDIVLASPVFRCIKKQIPDAELHFLTKKSFAAVTQANPYIDQFFYLQDNLGELIELLKSEAYDYVVDLHKNFRSVKVCKALKQKTFTINKLSLEKFLLTQLDIDVMPDTHITLRSMETVKALGVHYDGKGLDYFIPPGERVPKADIPHAHMAGYIAVVIGASYNTKKLPVHKLQELCKAINHPIILIGGKEDAEAGNAIAHVDETKIYNACGKFTLNESADLVRQAKLVVSHDTGLLYIACAFGIPSIAVWGATTPDLDVEPFYPDEMNSNGKQRAYENILVGLGCQPCSKYGTRTCPLGHFKCMRQQDIALIVHRIHSRLGC